MKLLKRMAVLSLVVLALGGCTKSSISTEAPVSAVGDDVDPAKTGNDDENYSRMDDKIIDDETEEQSLYEWDQVRSDTDDLFSDTNSYPQAVKMDFTADEGTMAISLVWTVKNDTTEDEAMEYASEMVRKFNDIVAVQSLDLQESSDTSFGSLWDSFSLEVQVVREDGTALIDKSYQAGAKIDLVLPENNDDGPESIEEEDVPKKI